MKSDLCSYINDFYPVDISINRKIKLIISTPQLCQKCGVEIISQNPHLRMYCSSACSATAESTRDKTKQTKLEKYGDENYTNRNKSKKTCLEKYGVQHYSQTANFQTKSRETKLKRYGDENYNNRIKSKKTKLEKYGDENYVNPDRASETNLKRYGYSRPLQCESVKEKSQITNLIRYNTNSHTQMHYSKLTLKKLNTKEWLIEQHHALKKTLSQIALELQVDNTTVGNYLRKFNIEILSQNYSYQEHLLAEYITETYNTKVITNNRTIINPYELDIYLPEYKLAIEYNGIYWHRPEVYGSKEQWFTYHQNKIDMCKSNGIRLLHLWENYGDHNSLLHNAINSIIDNKLEITYKEIYR